MKCCVSGPKFFFAVSRVGRGFSVIFVLLGQNAAHPTRILLYQLLENRQKASGGIDDFLKFVFFRFLWVAVCLKCIFSSQWK